MTHGSAARRLALAALIANACAPPAATPAAPTTPDPARPADTRDLPPGAEATSLLGQPLFAPDLAPATRARLEADLAAARADYERDPADADAIIWLGRRLAYPGRYRDAIDVFTRGIERHPGDARMYRHRGHRWITVRELDRAIADLEHAAALTRGQPDEVEPDGMPNPYGIPTSTLQGNIWYHLALAHYLKHDFERALPAWREALATATNDDMRVATLDWLYMTLRRMGRDAEARAVLAPVHADMEILENHAYHRRLLLYRGELEPELLLRADTDDPVQLATYGYGVANWYLYNGDRDRADRLFRRILDGAGWAAFGYIAAEAELAGGDAWADARRQRTGHVRVLYVPADGFAYADPATGRLTGVTIEIMRDFAAWVGREHGVALGLSFEEMTDWRAFYDRVVAARTGVFGLGNVTITGPRRDELRFSPPYLDNMAVLITHRDVPAIDDPRRAADALAGLRGLAFQGTLHEARVRDLRDRLLPGAAIDRAGSNQEILDRVADGGHFAFIDAYNYWRARDQGAPIRRHEPFDDPGEQFGVIMSRRTDWGPVMDAFFAADGGYTESARYRDLLAEHLGPGLAEALLHTR